MNKENNGSTATVTKTSKSSKLAPKAKVTNLSTETKKEEVKVIAKKKNIKTILPGLELDSSLFVTKPRGGAKGHDNLFKEGIISDTSEKLRRSQRRQIRTNMEKFQQSFIHYSASKDKTMLGKLKAYFEDYYSKVYRVNDFTVESIAGGNVKAERKAQLQKMFDIIKSIK
jgi:hypothetical protein